MTVPLVRRYKVKEREGGGVEHNPRGNSRHEGGGRLAKRQGRGRGFEAAAGAMAGGRVGGRGGGSGRSSRSSKGARQHQEQGQGQRQ